MKNTLALQLEEKNKKAECNRKYDQVYVEQIKHNIEKFDVEKVNLQKTKKENINLYKLELDKQLQDKANHRKGYHMNEAERVINQDLINQITQLISN